MKIKEQIQEYVDLMGKSIENANFENKEVYANFLAQTYYYVEHSTKLLAFSAGLMTSKDRTYFNRFIRHITEEAGHDLMAENDLNHLGYSLNNFPQSYETRMLWESQYYKIQHLDPVSLIGYIIPLEMLSAQFFPNFNSRVQTSYGPKACSFVKIHAEEDQDHIEKAFKVLDSLADERKICVIDNMFQTAIAYTAMIDSLTKKPILLENYRHQTLGKNQQNGVRQESFS